MAAKKLLIEDNLKDWRQRLIYTHKDFAPGYIYDGDDPVCYIDEEGREHVTPKCLPYYIDCIPDEYVSIKGVTVRGKKKRVVNKRNRKNG